MVTRQAIEQAYDKIKDDIVYTPVVYSNTLSHICGCQTLLKLESLQMTGAFKDRGALHKLLHLTPEERERGVITASAGNHAQAVAYHAQRLGLDAKVVMPLGTPLIKIVSTQNYGADVILHGPTFDDAYDHARELEQAEGRVFVHPFMDPLVIAGQGSIGIELMADKLCRNLDTIVCPIGGGGLISGIAVYVKATNPAIRIIGVEAAACASMHAAMEAGGPVRLPAGSSLADGIAVKQVGQINYELVKQHVDDLVTVDEDDIANAVLLLLEIEKIVAEGAGAAALAAMVKHKELFAGQRVLSLVCGGNIDVNILHRIITRGLTVAGRIVELSYRIGDTPGKLMESLRVIFEQQANILEVQHHRFDTTAPPDKVDISLTLETKGHTHIESVKQALREAGYKLL